MSTVSKCAFTYLSDVGYFVDTFKVNVLEQDVLPWLFDKVENFLSEMTVVGDFSDVLVGSNLDQEMSAHEKTVQAERDRRAAVQKAIEDAAEKRYRDKVKRKEARELARKQGQLKQLKEELNAKFV